MDTMNRTTIQNVTSEQVRALRYEAQRTCNEKLETTCERALWHIGGNSSWRDEDDPDLLECVRVMNKKEGY
jgi:hypothetical protein